MENIKICLDAYSHIIREPKHQDQLAQKRLELAQKEIDKATSDSKPIELDDFKVSDIIAELMLRYRRNAKILKILNDLARGLA